MDVQDILDIAMRHATAMSDAMIAAHFHCNASRKDKAGIEPLGTPSREW